MCLALADSLPSDPLQAGLPAFVSPLPPDSHFLQLLTPVQAGQLLNLIMRQFPAEERKAGAGVKWGLHEGWGPGQGCAFL